MYGLARLQHRPSEAWLERASELFRAAMRIACTPPSLVKFLFGFVGLQVRRPGTPHLVRACARSCTVLPLSAEQLLMAVLPPK